MTERLRISYVVPVHNQAGVLRESAMRLVTRLRDFPGSEALLIENGSTDESMQLCVELAQQLSSGEIGVRVAASAKGMGYALRRGIELAAGDVLVLTAADLPFGFTDLDAYLATAPRPRLAIGSKAHPQSHTIIPLQRRIMSGAFGLLRRVTVGLNVRDSQGTILLDRAVAQSVLPHLRCDDFLISAEIICWAVRAGVTPVELPITYVARGGSTVSPVRDSMRMAGGLLALRRRLRAARGADLGAERA
ncbi:MAG: glycosyltransferase [Chloroflexi bacterium]|nr:MAG: glycosyltransferase [Chloroflexota bacterium]